MTLSSFSRALALAASSILVGALASAEESPELRISGMTFVGSRSDEIV